MAQLVAGLTRDCRSGCGLMVPRPSPVSRLSFLGILLLSLCSSPHLHSLALSELNGHIFKNIKNKVYCKAILRRSNGIQTEHYWHREGLGSEKWEGFMKIRNMGIHGGHTEQAGKLHGLITQVERYSCHQ